MLGVKNIKIQTSFVMFTMTTIFNYSYSAHFITNNVLPCFLFDLVGLVLFILTGIFVYIDSHLS